MEQKAKSKKLKRSCTVCGEVLYIIVDENRQYIGGHYFGHLLPIRGVAGEYWECEKCFREEESPPL
ncbi:MAG: hypothetical protein WCO55_02810 [Candidatus Falkowbacteria bacterium]